MIIDSKPLDINLRSLPVDRIKPDFNQPRRKELELQFAAKGMDPNLAKRPEGIEMAKRFQELVRSIISNRGISMPLIVQKIGKKYELIDGDRRLGAIKHILTNNAILSENPDLEKKLARVPCLVINRELTDSEKYQLLSHLHFHTVGWNPSAKQEIFKELSGGIDGEQKAAASIGITIGGIKKQKQVSELAAQFRASKGERSESYAREVLNIRADLLTPQVKNVVIQKIKDGVISDVVQIRKLRQILSDPDAKAKFMEPKSRILDAYRVFETKQVQQSINGNSADFKTTVQTLVSTLKGVRFEEIIRYKGDGDLEKSVVEARSLLDSFGKYI
ncbi:MAG: hypothetical protein ACYCQJ_10480 [Nitrososphaerales archaeon]